MIEKKGELKFIVYLDDNGQTKEKYAIIKEDDFWIEIQIYDKEKKKPFDVPKFKIPKNRVLKIKEVKHGRPRNDQS